MFLFCYQQTQTALASFNSGREVIKLQKVREKNTLLSGQITQKNSATMATITNAGLFFFGEMIKSIMKLLTQHLKFEC